MKMLLANSEIIEISPSKMSDLFYATCGGMGLTGIILSATIKLLPIKSNKIIQKEVKSSSLEETCLVFDENNTSSYSVGWIDCSTKGSSQGKSIISFGEHAEDGELDFKMKKKIEIPKNFPSYFINKFSIKIFNKIYYASKNNNKTKNRYE